MDPFRNNHAQRNRLHLEQRIGVEASPSRLNSFAALEKSRYADSPSKEAASWGSETASDEFSTCPYGCCEQKPIDDFIFKRGFIEGACSDITVKAFGKDYPLHRLILDRSGYFSMLFNGPWNNPSNDVHELVFEDDENITMEAFEMAVAMLYGAKTCNGEQYHLKNLIAVGQFLDIQSVVCSATNQIIESLDFTNISSIASFAINNNYGIASDRIIDSVKGLLCSEGWQKGIKCWDGIPCSVIASVVGLDSFYIVSEWERTIFIIKLIERRQKLKKLLESGSGSSDSSFSSGQDVEGIEAISETLNKNVYFCHLTTEQLHRLEFWKNIYGEPYVKPSVLKDALWLSVSLHQKVATASKSANDLGLQTTSEDSPDGVTSWFVPNKDRTLYGTPDSIAKQVLEQEHISYDTPSGKTTENPDDHLYKVTKIPPYRFSVGFNTISEVDPEKRVYARTLWYAGSYWNLYLQKIKHKNRFQMGVYVHRATSSSPSKSGLLNYDVLPRGTNGLSTEEVIHLTRHVQDLNLNDRLHAEHSHHTEMNSPEASEDEELNGSDLDDIDDEDDEDDDSQEFEDANSSFLSYEDNRIETSVYCIIYTPSRKIKSSFTCFMSTPEKFKKSQSWGWKSNSMCSFNEDGTLTEGQEKVLKFMVVLGNV